LYFGEIVDCYEID